LMAVTVRMKTRGIMLSLPLAAPKTGKTNKDPNDHQSRF
jgi:hypothetical protein